MAGSAPWEGRPTRVEAVRDGITRARKPSICNRERVTTETARRDARALDRLLQASRRLAKLRRRVKRAQNGVRDARRVEGRGGKGGEVAIAIERVARLAGVGCAWAAGWSTSYARSDQRLEDSSIGRIARVSDQCRRRACTARSTRRFLSTTAIVPEVEAVATEAVAFEAVAAEPAEPTIAHEPNGPASACKVRAAEKIGTYWIEAPHEARIASGSAGASRAAEG